MSAVTRKRAADANRPDIVALDGEVSDSTFTEDFNRA
jgi:hypothetical protein